MLWKFSFASTSTLDALLNRDMPPTLEELLDEQEILSEVKSQNHK
jgi:SIT4-associating protein SAP185/190